MRAICHALHTNKRASIWKKIRIAGELGYGMIKWLNMPSDTLQHCFQGASMFYKAVDGFGHVHFGKKDYENACKRPCAQLGKP